MSWQDSQHHYVEYPVSCPHGQPDDCCCCATARAEAIAAEAEEHAGHLQQLLAGLYDLLDDSRAYHGVPAFDAARAYLAAHGLRRIS